MRVFASKFQMNAMLLSALDDIVDHELDLMQKIELFRNQEEPLI